MGSLSVPAQTDADGRTRITSRALNRVVTAVAADALGVEVRSVSVDLADEAGQLVVTVRSPLRVVSLTRVQDDLSLVARTSGTILERAAAAQQQIRRQAADLTGSEIARVVIRLTGVDIRTERRVS
ncbi:hypothetical protein D4765_14710 [Subtercola vilae]|uniref:Uncharacterized protein n=1 Tax=Subtercola vilae TaxID=2056433 RepID=A0A4T2BPN1_9MICO|nr:hypothetical protein D4765_14710 [Subtercola vilae]